MLSISMTDGNWYNIYIGQKVASKIDVGNISHIQADGQELDIILKIRNIPDCGKTVQKWYGENAKFIVSNLF